MYIVHCNARLIGCRERRTIGECIVDLPDIIITIRYAYPKTNIVKANWTCIFLTPIIVIPLSSLFQVTHLHINEYWPTGPVLFGGGGGRWRLFLLPEYFLQRLKNPRGLQPPPPLVRLCKWAELEPYAYGSRFNQTFTIIQTIFSFTLTLWILSHPWLISRKWFE